MKLVYYLYRLAGIIIPRMPTWLGYWLCRVVAGVSYQLNKAGRENVQRNVAYALGPDTPTSEINRRARLVFNYVFYNYFDMFRLPIMDDEAVRQLVQIEGWENVEQALSDGRGVVMVSIHLGNLEMIIYRMLLHDVTFTIPVERVEPPELFDYISNIRMNKGMNLVPIDGPLISMIRTLRKGGVAGVAGDRDVTGTGQVFDFFGHPAHLPDGHVRLAIKAKVPLIIGFSHRHPDQTHTAHFLPPFYVPTEGTEEERLAAGMNYIVTAMEQAIQANPEQWTLTVSIWADEKATAQT